MSDIQSSNSQSSDSPSSATPAEIRKILVATDFSEQALPGVAQAASLARRLDADLVLLHTVEDQLPPILGTLTVEDRAKILEDQRDRAEKHLADYAKEHLPGRRVETVTLIGVPERDIVEQAEARGVDLIVIASHGYGPLRQLLLGSTAERVLHHAPCPVLVVPSKGKKG